MNRKKQLSIESGLSRNLRTCLLFLMLLCGITLPQKARAISGNGFTDDKKIENLRWNATENRLEFRVLVMDDRAGSRNEWIDHADVYIDGQNVFDIGGPGYNAEGVTDETALVRIKWKHSSPNGTVLIRAQGIAANANSRVPSWENSAYYNYDIHNNSYGTSTYFWCSEIPADENWYQYAQFYWYPKTPITVDKTVTVSLSGIQIIEQASGDTKTIASISKSVTMNMSTATPTNQSITGGTIGTGGALSFNVGATGASSLILQKNKSTLETKSGANASFSGKYIKTESEFLSGVSFGFMIDKTPSNTYPTTYRWTSPRTLTSQRTGVFVNNLTATLGTCGNLNLSWQIKNPSATSNVNTQGFDLQVRKDDGSWGNISEISYNNVAGGTTSYNYTYQLPAGDMNKGNVGYEFRIKRKFASWDDADFGSVANNQNLFQRNTTLIVNTNYKELENIVIAAGTNNYPLLTWDFATVGIECTDNVTLKLRIGGTTETEISKNSILAGSYQTKGTDGILACMPQRYELILQYGTLPAITYLVNNSYVFEPTGKRNFEKIVVSKGYYPDKNNIKWYIEDGFDEFNGFRLLRKQMSEPDDDYVTVQEFTHNRGVLLYNYDDVNVNAGIYYTYKVEGLYSCNENSGSVPSPVDIGFSQPYGSVSGRVTYTGSSAVKDVTVNLTTNDALRSNRELEFSDRRTKSYVNIPANTQLFNREGFSFQAWINPTSMKGYIVNNNRFSISLSENNGQGFVNVALAGRQVMSVVDSIPAGSYRHITVTAKHRSAYQSYEISIYINDKLKKSGVVTPGVVVPPIPSAVYLGNNGDSDGTNRFTGLMDDIRFWNKALTEDEILLNYDRILSGKETGLVTYYKCDETDEISNAIFDCSAVGTAFNGNHAMKASGVNRFDVPVSSNHLTLKGVTDANGIYSITNAIPYTSEGTTYTLTPVFGIHKFDPSQRPLFFSPDSKVFNNVDFTDVSSFPVDIMVTYQNSNYPVDSVMVYIDGMPANKDGKSIVTENGICTVDVPIGDHFIELVKSGHVFADGGRFPQDPDNVGARYNFQTSMLGNNGLKFTDITTVRLMGRVVGGQPETDKPLGFGLSTANIGKAVVTLRTENDFRLNLSPNDSISTAVIGGKNITTKFKEQYAGSTIEIETDPETGEFIAELPPVTYSLVGAEVEGLGLKDDGTDGDAVDFAYSNQRFNMNPNAKFDAKYTDPATGVEQTFSYNDSVKITRYNEPTIIVVDKATKSVAFGDSIFVHYDDISGQQDSIPLYTVNNDVVTYTMGVPVLSQRTTFYTWQIEAFEEYRNNDNSEEPVVSRVPLAGKEMSISNALAAERIYFDEDYSSELERENSDRVLILDSEGKIDYRFRVSFPNMAGNHQLGAKLGINQNGKEYTWETSAILFGQLPANGSNFVTQGPEHVDIILRDPPGSNSSAFLEKGSSYKLTSEKTDEVTVTENIDLTIKLGSHTSTAKGIGVALIDEMQSYVDVETETELEEVVGNNNSEETSITFNQRISTSGDPNYVGAPADVYIGRSTNLIFGMMRQLALYPKNQLPEGLNAVIVGDYALFNKEVLTADENFETMFQYTQTHIINTQIPNIKELRNGLITTITAWNDTLSMNFNDAEGKPLSSRYVTLLDRSHPDFGKKDTYKWVFNPNYEAKAGEIFIEQVNEYNKWIENWETVIANNEREKVALIGANDGKIVTGVNDLWNNKNLFENLSYDAGTSIEKSLAVNYSAFDIDVFSFTGGTKIMLHSGFLNEAIVRIGLDLSVGGSVKRQQVSTDTEGTESSVVFGYNLSEDESVLFAGQDALSIDIFGPTSKELVDMVKGVTPKNLAGFTFVTRAGQTSCPHEAADSTIYYKNEAGEREQISFGTFKIENPEIYVDGKKEATAENIPAGREATFTLQLQNLSEAKIDVTYLLQVDPASNPDGLIITMDGEPLVAGRQIRIKYGEEQIKTLKVRQSSLDILDYEGIELRLSSVCDVFDYVKATLSAKFTPASSPVTLRAGNTLANRAALDADGSISFTISEYDRSFKNFGMIRLQYRSVNDVIWNTVQEYVNDEALYPLTGTREKIADYTLSYNFNYDDITPSDGEYVFRALAVSLIGTEEITTSSEEILVTKDVRAPQALGNPSPVNGILNAGDEISITFNEDIRNELFFPTTIGDYFSITGVLNGDIRMEPTSGLGFDGISSHAFTEMPVHTGGSFSIESWIQLPEYKAGTLFAYGENGNYFSLGFDATGHAVVKLGAETYTSQDALEASEVWKYMGVSYDSEKKSVSVYALEGDKNLNLIQSQALTGTLPAQGKFYIGNDVTGNSGFNGAVAQVHFYSAARTITDASVSKYEVKSGNEPNLIGLWELEEGEGVLAIDKARSRNLTLNTSWYVYPKGKSLDFNGTSDYAAISSGLFPFRPFDDFTWEFWFKGAAQQSNTLLSVGTSAYIGFNAAGELTLTAGENSQVLATGDLLDDQWHHFALSVKRGGTTRAYIDGKTTASFSTIGMIDGSIGGGNYFLGAKMTQAGEPVANIYSEYFKGNIDEVRVWDAALTTDAILLEKNRKLYGKEAGLKAYFPFEAYEKRDQIIQVYESLNDMVSGTSIGNMTATSDVAAPMQDARPVKDVPFTVTASERKIVLNITEEPYRLEGVTLKVSAKNILDVHSNSSSSYTWIAYVNQNALKWGADAIDMTMEAGATQDFKATVVNRGGDDVAYYIESIPNWLTVDAPTGNLRPLTSKELTFSISKAINIGSYEAAIVLRGDNNVREILPVALKVTGQRPDWSVNPANYESTMTVTGQITIEGIVQEDEDDMLGAFIGGECVGVVSPVYVPEYNAYFTFLNVYGNGEHAGQSITFKLWDASTGNIYPVIESKLNNVLQNTVFTANAMRGDVNTPVVHNALDVIEQSIALAGGWNWISANVTNANPSILQQFKDRIGSAGKLLKGESGYIQAPGWAGSLTSIDKEKMYLVNTGAASVLRFSGKAANPATSPITLVNEWNRIGYIPKFTLPVNEALSGLNAQVGDQIKGHSGYRTYMGAAGWIGSLHYMRPGEGYMYYSGLQTAQSFNYPSAASQLRAAIAATGETVENRWNVNVHKYSGTMTMTSVVLQGDKELQSELIELAAFAGDECRGSIMLQHVQQTEYPFIGFLLIFGEDENDDEITFKVYDHSTGNEYTAAQQVDFVSDAILGTPVDPVKISFGSTGISDVNLASVTLFPNPAVDVLHINYNTEKIDLLEMTDVSGRLILSERDFVKESINVSHLSEGVYFLKAKVNEQTTIHKFVKR